MEQTRQKWAGHGVVHPVEELFELRAEIRALKARESELRRYFIERAGPHERAGPFHQIQIRELRSSVLVKSRLPQSILDDPGNYDLRHSKQVRVLRRDQNQDTGFAAPLAQGWQLPPPDDFDVIEPFYG